jgi:hypothetical protein
MLRQTTATHTSQLDVLSDASACTSTSCIRNLISNHHSFDAKHSDEINSNQSCEYVKLREYGLLTYWPSDRARTWSLVIGCTASIINLLFLAKSGRQASRVLSDGSPLSARSRLLDFAVDNASAHRCMAMAFCCPLEICVNEASLCHLH